MVTAIETTEHSSQPHLPLNGEVTIMEPHLFQEEASGTLMEHYGSLSPEIYAATVVLYDDSSSRYSASASDLSLEASSFLRHIFNRNDPPHISNTAEHSASRISDSPALKCPPSTQVNAEMHRLSDVVNSTGNRFREALREALRISGDATLRRDIDRDIRKCNLSITDYARSLHAFFAFSGLSHPFILEDAFWEDFHAERNSSSLILAIVCHGLPFTKVRDKWKKQQLLADKCMERLIRTKASKTGTDSVRLDDLEAMALMVDFKYDNARRSSMRSTLRNLFMTHDALVLMTLQSRSRGQMDSDPSAMLARADERYTLLYWRVYEFDSFQCLDHKSLSLIQDNDLDLTEDPMSHEAGGYLDAILRLSIIARRIVSALCNATARATGIESSDIPLLYEQLQQWRNNNLPHELRRPINRAGEFREESHTSGKYTPIPASRQIHVHRAVLWALEINCYLQIDDCVARYGFRDGGTVRTETTALRTEYESLEATLEAVDLAGSIRERRLEDPDSEERPLVDLAPSTLRNICANVCKLVCSRGKRLSKLPQPQTLGNHSGLRREGSRGVSGKEVLWQRRADYAGIAKALRDTVAAASSHWDTEQMLGCLDDQLAFLQDD